MIVDVIMIEIIVSQQYLVSLQFRHVCLCALWLFTDCPIISVVLCGIVSGDLLWKFTEITV